MSDVTDDRVPPRAKCSRAEHLGSTSFGPAFRNRVATRRCRDWENY